MKSNAALCLFGATLSLGLIATAVPSVLILVRSDRRKVDAFDRAVGTASKTALKMTRSETIRVKGSASRRVISNYGSWSGSVSVTAPTFDEAALKLDAAEKKIVAFIVKLGFKPKEIVWGSISIGVFHRKNDKGVETHDVHHYQLSRPLQIAGRDVRRLETLDRTFTDLVKQGIAVSNHGASYLILDLDRYKMELLEAASKNAYARARILAESAGGQVGKPLSASQGVFQVLAPGGGNISDYGTYDKSTIEKEIKAVVTLEFSLK